LMINDLLCDADLQLSARSALACLVAARRC
jgi:hypothetical protein